MATKLVIPGITSFTGPKIYADPIMSKGSLLLWDPTHPSGGDESGIVTGAPLKNIAANISAGIVGGDPANMHPVIINNATTAGAASQKERSGKGGLCAIFSKLVDVETLTAASYLGFDATFLKEYLLSNRATQAIFASVWFRSLKSSRGGTSGAVAPQPIGYAAATTTSTTSYYFLLGGLGTHPGTVLGQRGLGVNIYNEELDIDAPRIVNVGVPAATGGWASAAIVGPRFLMGNADAWSGFNEPGASGIIERVYIEDLTVSGRTYAEVDAIDKALFDAAHAPGGSWHGDTYTDPATFP